MGSVPLWRQFWRGIHALRHGASADRDVADEITHYLEEATMAHEARGLAHDQAVRAARLDLGGETNIREQVRGSGWEHSMDGLIQDIRFAVRQLRRNSGFTIAAVLTLALGIGANAAIFSVVRGVLLKPLANSDENRLVYLRQSAQGIGVDNAWFSVPEIRDLRGQ